MEDRASSGSAPRGDSRWERRACTDGDDDAGPYGVGCHAFTADLRLVDWPTKFWPKIPEKYDGTIDLEEFLQIYTTAIQAAGGGPKVMATYFHVALCGSARSWLMNLPARSVHSWANLSERFIANFAGSFTRPGMESDFHVVSGGKWCEIPKTNRHNLIECRLVKGLAKNHQKEREHCRWRDNDGEAGGGGLGFHEPQQAIATIFGVGQLPVVVTPTICNKGLARVLIDSGAGLNLLLSQVFHLMQVGAGQLILSHPFYGVMKGKTTPLGKIPQDIRGLGVERLRWATRGSRCCGESAQRLERSLLAMAVTEEQAKGLRQRRRGVEEDDKRRRKH
ncbi:uncharacterized protein [Setaria viridis]|uniref:uncharacterized protein n=1 Tax=Setaria viridis TaxID=4556 RepID=UPI003B3BCD7C